MVAQNDGWMGKHGLVVTENLKKLKRIRARVTVIECEGRTRETQRLTPRYACTQTGTSLVDRAFRSYEDLPRPRLAQIVSSRTSTRSVRLARVKAAKLAGTGSWLENKFSLDSKSCG